MPSALKTPPEPDPAAPRTVDAGADLVGLRVDKALTRAFPGLSRSRIQGLMDAGTVRVNGRTPKSSAKIRAGDRLSVVIPAAVPSNLEPECGDLHIVHEDESLLVVVKPAGLVVHPGAGVTRGTLAAFLLAHCGTLSQIGGVTRPGIVHRLDKGTSGLLVVAKSDAAHHSLSTQFKGRTVTKLYSAICHGTPRPTRGSVLLPIGRDPRSRQRMAAMAKGRAAHTDYEVTEIIGPASVVEVELHTGRTHQIRVHLAALGCPLVGDNVYGASALAARALEPARSILSSFPRPALHARVLGFSHPLTGKALRFEAPWPQDLVDLRRALASGSGERRDARA